MKFQVQMKDPDTLHDAIRDAVKEFKFPDLTDDEADLVRDKRIEDVGNLCSQWFTYSEYLTVEIDTDAGTCTVVKGG